MTHKAGPLVPMLNVCTIIGTSTLPIQRESSLLLGTLLIRSKGKRARCQRTADLFSYVKILGKPIEKQVNINLCKYVCMKLLLGKLTICSMFA